MYFSVCVNKVHDLSIYHNNKNNCYYYSENLVYRQRLIGRAKIETKDTENNNNNKEACRKNETDGSLTVLVV